MARAIATRCCWPPESSAGVWCSRPVRPTCASASIASSRRSGRGHAAIDQRQLDILGGGGARQQIVALEDEADVQIAQDGAPAAIELAGVDAEKRVAAGARRIEAADDVHRRRLARAGRTHDGDELAARDVEIDAGQRIDPGLALAVALPDLVEGDERAVIGPTAAPRRWLEPSPTMT